MINVYKERLCEVSLHIPSMIPLHALAEAIINFAGQEGIPVFVKKDSVQVGGSFREAEPAVVVYHLDHMSDYYSYILLQRQQGYSALLSMYLGGDSKSASGIIKPKQKKRQMERAYYDLVQRAICNAIFSFFE